MSTSFAVRPAKRRDAKTIAALLEELILEEEGAPRAVDPEGIASALFTPRAVELRALVVEQGGETAGVALYHWGYDTLTSSEGYKLADIVVTGQYRRQGMARSLMAGLAAQCLREGGQWISLTVLRKNDAAQAFYRSLGMVEMPVAVFAIGPKALFALSEG